MTRYAPGLKRAYIGGCLGAYGVVAWAEHDAPLAGLILFAMGVALAMWAERAAVSRLEAVLKGGEK